MKFNKYTFIQVILWIITLLLVNAGSVFLLVSNMIDVDVTTLTADETYSKTVRYLIKVLKSQVENTGEAAYLTYWQLLTGWRSLLVYLSMGVGFVISGVLIFKFTMSWIENNKQRIQAKKDDILSMKKYFILKSKINSDNLNDKDIAAMEKELENA